MTDKVKVQRALISVSDKTGIEALGKALAAGGVSLLSTGGTATALKAAGIDVEEVSAYTGFPEIMEGRVKTLHPKIHGGILARRGVDDAVMQAHGIEPIDLLVINLYPFASRVAEGAEHGEVIETIDVGGPSMIRGAAKNYRDVAVVVDPSDYPALLQELASSDFCLSAATRNTLAAKAFRLLATYDAQISNYLGGQREGGEQLEYPRALSLTMHKLADLRYGENPHQSAALYRRGPEHAGAVATATQLQGKTLSYNNILDTDAAVDCVAAFEGPACVIVKHLNPCGVAVSGSLLDAYEKAYRTDPTSAFGGVIAINEALDKDLAETIVARQFVEIIAAPAVTSSAKEVLKAKPNVRVLELGSLAARPQQELEFRTISGGLLVQQRDLAAQRTDLDDLRIVTKRAPDDQEIVQLFFAWRVVRCVRSNAIVYAGDGATLGIGAGQSSRVDSARIGVQKAAAVELSLVDSVMASDAFFPFRDSIDAAAAVGVRAVIQPGGSQRDEEVIAAADEHGIAMLFTGERHFKH